MEVPAVVIDSGGYLCRVGTAGSYAPSTVLQCLEIPADSAGSVRRPILRGVVQDWDAMEQLWLHAVTVKMGLATEEHPCFIAESPACTEQNRAKTIEVMFESFNVPAFYARLGPLLCLSSTGRARGLVLDIGDSISASVSVVNDSVIYSGISELAGCDLTEYMKVLLGQKGEMVTFDEARIVKERLSFVAENFETEMKNSELPCYIELPDGRLIGIDREPFLCSESLFQPSFIGKECPSLPDLLSSALHPCGTRTRKDLCAGVILSGGSSNLRGIQQRLCRELQKNNAAARVVAPHRRELSTWIGGSILCSLSTINRLWVTRREYQEYGCDALKRRRRL